MAPADTPAFTGQLTPGGVARVYQEDTTGKPIVQVIDLKVIGTPSTANNTGRRYRLIISDGVHFQQAMLATQMNTLVAEERLQNLGIIRMEEFVTNVIAKKRYVPVEGGGVEGSCAAAWSVLEDEVGERKRVSERARMRCLPHPRSSCCTCACIALGCVRVRVARRRRSGCMLTVVVLFWYALVS